MTRRAPIGGSFSLLSGTLSAPAVAAATGGGVATSTGRPAAPGTDRSQVFRRPALGCPEPGGPVPGGPEPGVPEPGGPVPGDSGG